MLFYFTVDNIFVISMWSEFKQNMYLDASLTPLVNVTEPGKFNVVGIDCTVLWMLFKQMDIYGHTNGAMV